MGLGRVTMRALLAAVVAAFVSLSASGAQAVTVTLTDGSSTVSSSGTPFAFFVGSVGDFGVNVSFAASASAGNNRILQSTSVASVYHGMTGPGTLTISVEEDFSASTSAGTLFDVTGTAGAIAVGDSVSVSHFIDTGAGFTQIGNPLEFFSQASTMVTSGLASFGSSPFSLKTVIEIVHSSIAQVSNVHTTLTADLTAVTPAPLPAALPLFGAGLVGLGLLGWRKRRRERAAT